MAKAMHFHVLDRVSKMPVVYYYYPTAKRIADTSQREVEICSAPICFQKEIVNIARMNPRDAA